MWFRIEDQNYIGKKVIHDEYCKIFVSNFIYVWYKVFSNSEIFSAAQKFNPLFEASPSKLKEITLNLFDENEAVEKKLIKEEENITLNLEGNQVGVKFYFQVTLCKGNEELLYNEFICPLLIAIIELQEGEKKLLQAISKKNSQLEECKSKKHYLLNDIYKTELSLENVAESCNLLTSNEWNTREFLKCISQNLYNIEKKFKNDSIVSTSSLKIDDKLNDKIISRASKKKEENSTPRSCFVQINHQIIKKRKKDNKIF